METENNSTEEDLAPYYTIVDPLELASLSIDGILGFTCFFIGFMIYVVYLRAGYPTLITIPVWCFAILIAICGVTHLVNFFSIWFYVEIINFYIKILTLIQSVITIAVIVKIYKEVAEVVSEIFDYQTKIDNYRQCVSLLTHEIRTPLSGISGSIDLMRIRMKKDSVDPLIGKYIENIESCSKNLDKIIKNILVDFEYDLSSGKVKIRGRIFKTESFFKSIYETYTFRENRSKINFHIENLFSEVYSDDTKLQQVITNIINNSDKFNQKNNLIDVYLSMHTFKDCEQKLKDRTVLGTTHYPLGQRGAIPENFSENAVVMLVRVRDSGSGIPSDKLKIVFKKFEKVNHSGYTNDGIGLGLNLCKNIVQSMKGNIFIDSKSGYGTEMVMYVPINVVSKKLITVEGNDSTRCTLSNFSEKTKGSGLTVAIVDDSKINIELLKRIIRIYNFTVVEFKDGLDVYNYCKDPNNKCDIIFMDIYMPNMDGFIATKNIKQIPFRKNTVIIAYTAMIGEGTEDEQLDFLHKKGFYNKIEKPLNSTNIQEVVGALIHEKN